MISKFREKATAQRVNIVLAVCFLLGLMMPMRIQATEINQDYSVKAFQNLEYTFQTTGGETVSSRALPSKNVTLLFFGKTTCASSWLTLKNIAESRWIQDTKISVLYIDIDGADAEVIQGSIDQFAEMSTNKDAYRLGCEKIIFCHDAGDKNEEIRRKYHSLSGKWGTIALPMIMLVDKNNIVREMLCNYQDADEIWSVINRVIITGNAVEEDKKDETGKDDTGKDDTGKDDTGKNDTENNNIGKDDTEKGETGKENSGNSETEHKPVEVRPEHVRLSKISLKYNGKAQRPTVIANDGAGNQISSEDYSVAYSNNINVGQATAMITFKNSYSGIVKKTFLIVPKGTALVRLTPKRKGFVVQWKKQKKQITGYEIQYSENRRFKGAKVIKNIKTGTTVKKVAKLKERKKYYVRIRTYKIVKADGKNTKLYSDWSNLKKVKTMR